MWALYCNGDETQQGMVGTAVKKFVAARADDEWVQWVQQVGVAEWYSMPGNTSVVVGSRMSLEKAVKSVHEDDG